VSDHDYVPSIQTVVPPRQRYANGHEGEKNYTQMNVQKPPRLMCATQDRGKTIGDVTQVAQRSWDDAAPGADGGCSALDEGITVSADRYSGLPFLSA
jgi:hypothetical protein